jgi:hypothetical protein
MSQLTRTVTAAVEEKIDHRNPGAVSEETGNTGDV